MNEAELNNTFTTMTERPFLSTRLESQAFRNFYYLKEELCAFCRSVGLSAAGSKQELTERIARFLETGEKVGKPSVHKPKRLIQEITPKTVIEKDIVCSEKHRAFFRREIGKSFTFNIAFQKWLKSHAGSTYADAVTAWYEIRKAKKSDPIGKQFEYNTYICDFFADNPGKSLQEAIRCWTFKKAQSGVHRYERTDIERSLP